jgi:exosortase H (IPTLxxWG-CTERM-specific)
MYRFVLIFLLLFALGWLGLKFAPDWGLRGSLDQLNASLAWLTATFINFFGSADLYPQAIIEYAYPGASFSLQVVDSCNALDFTWLLYAAILAYPCGWRDKLIAILLGFISVQLINIIRLISLFQIGIWYPQYFDLIHEYFWPLVLSLYVITWFLLWLWWLQRADNFSQF